MDLLSLLVSIAIVWLLSLRIAYRRGLHDGFTVSLEPGNPRLAKARAYLLRNLWRCMIPAILLALAAPADAQFRRVVQQCNVVHHQAAAMVVQQREVIVPVLTPFVFQADPRISYLYSGNYAAPAYTAPAMPQVRTPAMPSALERKLDRLLDHLMQQPRSSGPPDVPGMSPVSAKVQRTFVDVLAQNCKNCHSGPASKGGFVLFEGSELSPGWSAAKAFEQIAAGTMPPPSRPRITAADREILEVAFGLK